MKNIKKAISILCALAIIISSFGLNMTVFADTDEDIVKLETSKVGSLTDRVSNYDVAYNKNRNGLYFIKETALGRQYNIVYYDIDTKTYKNVYQIKGSLDCAKVYGDYIYFVSTSDKELPEKVTDQGEECQYECSVSVYKYDMNKQKRYKISLDSFYEKSYYLTTDFGVDSKGRMYYANNGKYLCVFDENGKLLNKKILDSTIYEFYGFDNTNGNFYYQGIYNWVYWGYSHYMASLMSGNIDSKNNISISGKNLMLLYQKNLNSAKNPIEMISGKYLAALSLFLNNANLLTIIDSNSFDYKDYDKKPDEINAITGGVSVPQLNVKNLNVIKQSFRTAKSVFNNNGDDISSNGSRSAMSSDEKSVIVKTDSNVLTQYDIESGKEKIKFCTSNSIYKFFISGDNCYVVERGDDKNYYLEKIKLETPKDFSVNIPETISVGDSEKISCTSSSKHAVLEYTYKSSNPDIINVDSNGKLIALKTGSAVISIISPVNGVKKYFTINANDANSKLVGNAFKVVKLQGVNSSNIHLPKRYGYYGCVTNSYLISDKNDYIRVENIGGNIYSEKFDKNGNLLYRKTIKKALPKFGGFYSSGNYYYLVFGDDNKNESNSKEVIRVVKYDKNWKFIAQCSIKGANTYTIFDAGGLSMTDSEGKLYIHTCHEMYKEKNDLYHHQANCTFVIKESDMSLSDSFYNVSNLSNGYVSHSFSQIIKNDGEYIYRVDLGDAYPRGIAYTRTKISDSVSSPYNYGTILPIPGGVGNNYTGYSLDGMELSNDTVLVTGCGVKNSSDKNKNVYISSVSKNDNSVRNSWITNYNNNSKISCLSSKLVKISDDLFLLMWEEKNNESYVTKMALVSDEGKPISAIYSTKLALSECQPIVDNNGHVLWYFTNGYFPSLIEINPYLLSSIETYSQHKHIYAYCKTVKASGNSEDGYTIEQCLICGAIKKNIISKGKKIPKNTLAITESQITHSKSDNDFKGSSFVKLQVQNTKTSKKSVSLKWNRVNGADGYIIYGNKCGKNNKYKKIKAQSGTSFTQKKLKKGTYYKYTVVAYKNVNGQQVTLAVSPTVHICTAGGKKGNPKSVKLNKKKVTLKKGKSYKIKATQVKDKKAFSKHKGVRYESSNTAVAAVSKSGKVKAKKKGKATIYCYAQNGKMSKVKITVK